MAQISALAVKELREITGAGLMDCKKALQEVDGDKKKAQELLKKRGLEIAAKKSSRDSDENRIFICPKENSQQQIAYIELSAETDFVARNDKFVELGQMLAKKRLELNDKSWQEQTSEQGQLASEIISAIQELGENIQLKNHQVITGKYLGYYLHNTNRLLSIVDAQVSKMPADSQNLDTVLKQVCMHITANKVEALKPADVNPDFIAAEKKIFEHKAANKPEELKQKIIAGQINKLLQEVALEKQPFLMDPDLTVFQWLNKQAQQMDIQLELLKFYKIVV